MAFIARWMEKRARRKARRGLPGWAARNAAFVRDNGLASVCFRSDGEIHVHAAHGVVLKYDPALPRSVLALPAGGMWEPHETQLMLDQLAGAQVFFDIGANTGWFSLVAGRCMPNLAVHAFEPVPSTCRLLAHNVGLNALSNVTVNNLGLWSQSGQLRFTNYRGPKNHITTDPRETRVDVVPVVRLDDYVRDHNIQRIDLIKCDVEGAELHMLQGAADTLGRLGPKVLLETEASYAERFGSTPRQVLEHMLDLGYRYSVVTEEGVAPASGDIQADTAKGYDFLFERR